MEAFIRANTSVAAFEGLDRELRERTLANGANFFANEVQAFATYLPDEARLAAAGVPVDLLVSAKGEPADAAVMPWLEARLGVEVKVISGHHAPYMDEPKVFAEELRPLLHGLLQHR